jgi:mono/diheme cytochrome c family protein
MRTLWTVLACIAVLVLGALAFIYSGIYNVGAASPDNPVVAWALHQTFEHSVARHSAKIQVPANLETSDAIQSGGRFFSQNCVICHGAPGQQLTAISQGLNPEPPDLLDANSPNDPAEVFWIVKNGIKMSGMPSFGKTQTDAQIWAIAAFLHKARGITAEEYQNLTGAPPGTPNVKPNSG